jgi:hypothetical protein
MYFLRCDKRLSDAQIRQALLAVIPSGSDVSDSEEDSEDEYVPKSRDRDFQSLHSCWTEHHVF